MNEPFPHLLVATEFPPNAPGGGPAVVRQMLRDWPSEKLSWWSCLPELDQKFGQKVAAHEVSVIPRKLYPHRRWGRQKSWVLEHIWTRWAATRFKRTLKTLRPEVVWTIPHCWSIPPLARVLPRAGIGFHVSIHDYADCGSFVQSFSARAARRLLGQADRLYARCNSRDAICQPMLDDLLKRVGQEGTVARAGLEEDDFVFLQNPPITITGPIRIAYAGTIQVDESFALFVSALQQIRGRLPQPISLEFFGNHSYRTRPWFDAGWMNEHGNLAAAELAANLRKCDWGFSPMSLTDDDPRYNHFSLPTKFISYLGAALPVITLGHPESSVVKMAQTYKVGICITTANVKQISDQLAAALAEPHPKALYLAEIRRCARSEFDAGRMRSLLYKSFQQCAEVTHIARP